MKNLRRSNVQEVAGQSALLLHSATAPVLLLASPVGVRPSGRRARAGAGGPVAAQGAGADAGEHAAVHLQVDTELRVHAVLQLHRRRRHQLPHRRVDAVCRSRTGERRRHVAVGWAGECKHDAEEE